jgi:hypothetical protein
VVSRVLVLCFDPLTDRMPGPAIRAWQLALQLARDHQVVLAGTNGATRQHPSMTVRPAASGDIGPMVADADVCVAPTSVVRRHPEVAARPLCIDMYIPTHLENLEGGGASEEQRAEEVAHQVAVINDDLRTGDFFLCASERQRDFWLGSLASLGRVNPATYGEDPTMRALIDVVPFGVDLATQAERSRGALLAAFPDIGPGDPVVVWGGGVYNWFDPLSLLEAVDRLRKVRPGLRLVFLGMRNPNPEIPEMRTAVELRAASDRLGLTGTTVLFNEGWIPYDQWSAVLAGADVGVSTHLLHVETHFSFRTRVLDYLGAGLPTVLTEGDTLSAEIAAAGLGVAVPPGDPAAIAQAIDAMLTAPPSRQAVAALGARYAWSAVCGPLLAYAANPRRAADQAARRRPDAPRAADAVPPVADEIRRLAARIGRGAARRIHSRSLR